jgi:N-ethylmaleimide reductase
MKIFEQYTSKQLSLNNRIVMAPMTRNRATPEHLPTDIMAHYYARRASAGLIVTEGTAPSKNGVGYARISGIYDEAHIAGWRKVTAAVHEQGGKIFLQLMHTGRVGHPLNMPPDSVIMAPSAVATADPIYTDQEGMVNSPQPKAMDEEDIKATQAEFVQAARNAIKAGFDGVELHGANGYLLDQFLNANTNHRKDRYGGSPENRVHFALEVVTQVANAIGSEKVAIRISPYGVFNSMGGAFEGIDETYDLLSKDLNDLSLAYLHLVYDFTTMGAHKVPEHCLQYIRRNFSGTLMLNGGFDRDSANAMLASGNADLISFGRPFIANADLVEKFKLGKPLSAPDPAFFYSAGSEGYL